MHGPDTAYSGQEYQPHAGRRFPSRATAFVLALSGLTGVSACDSDSPSVSSPETSAASSVTQDAKPNIFSAPFGTVIEGGDKSKHDRLFQKLLAVDRLQEFIRAKYDYTPLDDNNINALIARLPKINKKNSFNPVVERKAVAAMIADDILLDAISDDPQRAKRPNDVDKLLKGADIAFVKDVKSAFGAKKVGEVLDDIGSDSQEPEDALPELAKYGFKISEDTKRLAQRLDAEDALYDVYTLDDLDESIKDIGVTKDEDISNLIRNNRDYIIASDITDNYPYIMTQQEAKKAAGSINDPTVRAAARKYILSIDRDDYKSQTDAEWKIYDFSNKVDNLRYSLAKKNDADVAKLNKPAGAIEAQIEESADQSIQDLSDEGRTAIKHYNRNLGVEKLEPLDGLSSEPSLMNQLDLSNITSEKILSMKAVGENVYDPEFIQLQQFAELYSDGEKLLWHFESSSEIPKAQQMQITDLINPINPFIEAAMKSGSLISIRFGVDDTDQEASDLDFAPYYNPVDRTVYMILPKNKSVSGDMMRSSVLHEVVHALVNDAYRGAKVTEQEVEDINKSCRLLANNTRELYEDNLNEVVKSLSKLVQTTKGLDNQMFRTLLSSVKKGTVEELAFYFPDLEDSMSDCDTPYFWDSFNYIAVILGKSDKFDSTKFHKKYKNNQYFKDVVFAWNKAVVESSLYAGFNEASYVKSESIVIPAFGHSKDNATELMASLVDAVVTHTKYMREMYNKASEDEQSIIRRSIEASLAILVNRSPELKDALMKSYRRIVE